MKPRMPIVGVLGSHKSEYAERYAKRAKCLGQWLAERGVHLLTGGGGGVMAAVSKAFYESPDRRGFVIGIIPCEKDPVHPKSGYPNKWVEIPIFTHLPGGETGTDLLSRNHINVLTSEVMVALPGGTGTASEVALALLYKRPIVAFLGSRGEIPELPAQVRVQSDFREVCKFVEAQLKDRGFQRGSS